MHTDTSKTHFVLTCFVIPERSSHDHNHHFLRHHLCGP